MGARRFATGVSRFLQPDLYRGALSDLSLGSDPLTQNRYSLAGGNPLSFIEWDGHTVYPDGSATAQSAKGYGAATKERRDEALRNSATDAGNGWERTDPNMTPSVDGASGSAAGSSSSSRSGCDPSKLYFLCSRTWQRNPTSPYFLPEGARMITDLGHEACIIAGPCDLIEALEKGDHVGAGLAAAGMLPFGWAGKGGSLLRRLRSLGRTVKAVTKGTTTVGRSLDDLASLRGATPDEIQSLISEGWVELPLKKGEGVRFLNPDRPGEAIMIEKGWPEAKGMA